MRHSWQVATQAVVDTYVNRHRRIRIYVRECKATSIRIACISARQAPPALPFGARGIRRTVVHFHDGNTRRLNRRGLTTPKPASLPEVGLSPRGRGLKKPTKSKKLKKCPVTGATGATGSTGSTGVCSTSTDVLVQSAAAKYFHVYVTFYVSPVVGHR
eukprot:GHVU01068720.1.p1 GENE.GHVU01068720.1~~GHVU01068720.1.p1  ORF type:complete len:158 (-),score=6.22 GHVU01068720.1:230-703(-)